MWLSGTPPPCQCRNDGDVAIIGSTHPSLTPSHTKPHPISKYQKCVVAAYRCSNLQMLLGTENNFTGLYLFEVSGWIARAFPVAAPPPIPRVSAWVSIDAQLPQVNGLSIPRNFHPILSSSLQHKSIYSRAS